jgi:hypothetical protein
VCAFFYFCFDAIGGLAIIVFIGLASVPPSRATPQGRVKSKRIFLDADGLSSMIQSVRYLGVVLFFSPAARARPRKAIFSKKIC